MTGDEIADCFAAADECAPTLNSLYHINRRRPTQCKTGALDLINDIRFALPVDVIAERWADTKKPVYRYVFDQPNPWQSSSRAHHANDLTLLFGGVDFSHNANAMEIGRQFRESLIAFVHGSSPWPNGEIYAFGPLGRHGVLSRDEFSLRRRTACLEYFREIGPAKMNAVFGRLAAGRISLLN